HREERLFTFVAFAAIVLSWIAVQEQIGEIAFNYQVTTQTQALIVSTRNLAHETLSLVDMRLRETPPPPQQGSWEADLEARARFEAETVRIFEHRLGDEVRTVHDLLTLRNLRDRDLDAFYRRPANAFQIRVIGQRLESVADRLERESQFPH